MKHSIHVQSIGSAFLHFTNQIQRYVILPLNKQDGVNGLDFAMYDWYLTVDIIIKSLYANKSLKDL